ncbi:MAG: type II toxin-antitoxin system VapB family antitoxin [Azonexaceae bacterium]|nr:type II toxin-antitoxin system VapB family antitoxin [Azonexaceae bacterium]
MTITAKIFMNGRSQALRLPAKLRLEAKEVRVEKIGDALWLQPLLPAEQDMGRWLEHFYASTEPLPVDFLAEREDAPAQERDWS